MSYCLYASIIYQLFAAARYAPFLTLCLVPKSNTPLDCSDTIQQLAATPHASLATLESSKDTLFVIAFEFASLQPLANFESFTTRLAETSPLLHPSSKQAPRSSHYHGKAAEAHLSFCICRLLFNCYGSTANKSNCLGSEAPQQATPSNRRRTHVSLNGYQLLGSRAGPMERQMGSDSLRLAQPWMQ